MKKLNQNEQGHILVGTIMFIMILAISSLSFLTFTHYQSTYVERELGEAQAVINAEIGLDTVLNQVRLYKEPTYGALDFKTINFDDNDFGSGEATKLKSIGREYRDPKTWDPHANNKSVVYEITSVGVFDPSSFQDDGIEPIKRTLQFTYIPSSWADKLYLTDKESSSRWENPALDVVRFWGPDEINGILHSNDVIHMLANGSGGPRFYGYVTSAADDFSIEYQGSTPYFAKGYKLGVDPIEFSYTADDVRENAVIRWVGNTCFAPETGYPMKARIEFLSSGDFIYKKIHEDYGGFTGTHWDSLYPDALDSIQYDVPGSGGVRSGSIWSEMTVEVFGRVKGDVTVGSAKNIRIIDDLVYVGSPMVGGSGHRGKPPDNCRYYLGLISEMNVMVANTRANRDPDNGNPGDNWGIVINAAIAAIGDGGLFNSGDWTTGGGSFSVEDMNTSVPTKDLLDGEYMLEFTGQERTLTVWGAIAQRYRGFVHRSNGFNTDGGFSNKDYNYDTRLRSHPPPDWPRISGSVPSLIGWRETTFEDYD